MLCLLLPLALLVVVLAGDTLDGVDTVVDHSKMKILALNLKNEEE